MSHSLSNACTRSALERLDAAWRDVAALSADRPAGREPAHVVYGGAHLFKPDTPRKLGDLALRAMDDYAPDWVSFARAVALPDSDRLDGDAAALATKLDAAGSDLPDVLQPAWLARTVHDRVRDKLTHEPIEDYRLDFEDGYGYRSDDEEDATAASAAQQLASAYVDELLPPFCGIRIKPFTPELRERAIRTLDIFVSTLLAATDGGVPANFVVTLPKVSLPDEVAVLAGLLGDLEQAHRLEPGALRLEIMIETPHSLVAPDGRIALPALLDAADGRCVAAHFGPYDYTASLGVQAAHQHLQHPAARFARELLQVAASGAGVRPVDGPTNIMPIPPYRPPKAPGDSPLTDAQREANRRTIHNAWRLHGENVSQALQGGIPQGWDLHPAQLPVRFAYVFMHFLSALPTATRRLKAFLDQATTATMSGDVFDDAATGRGLLNFFARGLGAGALDEADVTAAGLTLDELHTGSFAQIVRIRRGR